MTVESSESSALIVRGVLSLARRLRAERPKGTIGLSALGVLSTLHRLGPMPAARLAAEERLQPQSLTRIIAGLERHGLIARHRSDADRRAILIAPTRRGLKLLSDDIKARRVWLREAMALRLSLAERETLLAASELMLRLAGASPRGATPSLVGEGRGGEGRGGGAPRAKAPASAARRREPPP